MKAIAIYTITTTIRINSSGIITIIISSNISRRLIRKRINMVRAPLHLHSKQILNNCIFFLLENQTKLNKKSASNASSQQQQSSAFNVNGNANTSTPLDSEEVVSVEPVEKTKGKLLTFEMNINNFHSCFVVCRSSQSSQKGKCFQGQSSSPQ